jgi:hypothetical protein
LNAWTNLYETWYVYYGTWAHLNGILHKSLSSVSVSVCVSPLSLLHNGSVNTFPRQLIHETRKNFWTRRFLCGPCCIKGESVDLYMHPLIVQDNGSVNTVPRQQRIVGGVVFYAVRIVSKESTQLVLPRTSCSKHSSLR